MEKLLNKLQTKLEHWQIIMFFLVAYDCVVIIASYFAALWLRFDCHYGEIPVNYLEMYFKTILPYTVFCVFVFFSLKLYKSIWRFASYNELLHISTATIITLFGYVVAMIFVRMRMPISYYVFGIVIQFVMTVAVRFAYRFILLLRGRYKKDAEGPKACLIYGAGNSGQTIFRDIKRSIEMNEVVKCFIDDNSNKWGRYIDNVVIFGGRDRIVDAVNKYNIEKIYIAIPSATSAEKREVLSICEETNCEVMSLPGLYQFTSGEISVSKMKPVAVEDLLGRDPIRVDMTDVFKYIEGKVVMVTGGGGSIGSELCRQVAMNNPKQLIIFDVYENNAYDIQQELRKKYPNLNLQTIIGSVRDSRMIFKTFDMFRPEIVYHAAAHKHVPLMEDSPCESIKNNALGTYKTAYAAMVHGCKKFVLISTDKAVNPTNIMGATRIIETTKKYQGCLKQNFKNLVLILRTAIGGILESFLLLIDPRSEKVILSL